MTATINISTLPAIAGCNPWRKIVKLFASILPGQLTEAEREQRFARLVNDYGALISRVCFSYSSSTDDFNDLRQDVLINIWNGLKTYRGDAAESTWIYRVAFNTCVSTVRKRTSQPRFVAVELNMDVTADEADNDLLERIEWLHRQIDRLTPIDKAVITMWLDERSYDEIAEVTGLSRNNVAVKINRIKARLSHDTSTL